MIEDIVEGIFKIVFRFVLEVVLQIFVELFFRTVFHWTGFLFLSIVSFGSLNLGTYHEKRRQWAKPSRDKRKYYKRLEKSIWIADHRKKKCLHPDLVSLTGLLVWVAVVVDCVVALPPLIGPISHIWPIGFASIDGFSIALTTPVELSPLIR